MGGYHPFIKEIHILCALGSFTLFVLRGLWAFREPRRLGSVWARIVPHVNDTVLLTTGVLLALIIHQYPGTDPWLTAKMVALLIHILLGALVFRGRLPLRLRVGAWVGSLLAFLYIVAVAFTRQPLLGLPGA